MTPKRYGVRRFCPQGSRPDCFEVYQIATGDCASFGMRKREAERAAKQMNKDFEEQVRLSNEIIDEIIAEEKAERA